MKSYFPFILSGFITLLAVYLSHRSRMKLLKELKSEFETTTHRSAESIKTHKPTKEYIKFLEKPNKKKALRKFRLSRPSKSVTKTFAIGVLILFISVFLMSLVFKTEAAYVTEEGTGPFWYLSMAIFIFVVYGLYLIISSIIRAFYKDALAGLSFINDIRPVTFITFLLRKIKKWNAPKEISKEDSKPKIVPENSSSADDDILFDNAPKGAPKEDLKPKIVPENSSSADYDIFFDNRRKK